MRRIDKIIIHCSATKEGLNFNRNDIERWHLAQGYNKIGYHYVITLDGTVESGRSVEEVGAHCKGYNSNSIGICYIGGVGEDGKAKDTRTIQQKAALYNLLVTLKNIYPNAKIMGHRDLSPDKNGDGKITPEEWLKQCPSFDAIEEYGEL